MVLGFGLAGLAATPAQAEDDVFGYTYTAETLPKGETEMELWATDRRGKVGGHYDAQDYRIELEHGITDSFTVSAYANFAGIGLVVDPPLPAQHEFEMLDGVRDVNGRAVDSGLLQSGIENRPRWPDERPPGKVLLIPGLLADEDH